MPRIADVLEHESTTVDLEQGDFERLLGRRERKERSRRIRAGAVGVIVALAVGILLVRSLTSDPVPATPPEPRPAPAGVPGALAYGRDGHVYIADPNGSNAVQIAGRSADCGRPADFDPMWSPDGRYLAFLRGCPDPVLPLRHVVVISYPDRTVVAEFSTRAGFEWSPDSTRIAVWGDPYWKTLDVYGIDGSLQVSLTSPLPDGQGSSIMWMPDGSSLLLYRYTYESRMVVPMDVVRLDGTAAAELPGGLPITSPDGTRVAVVSDRSTVVTDADGAPLFEVDLHLDDVVWSPDGDRFASTVGAYLHQRLVVVDTASGEVRELAEARAALLRYRRLHPRIEGVVGFSPDGDRILYVGWGTGYTPFALYSIGVDGSDPHVLVKWSKEGQWRPR